MQIRTKSDAAAFARTWVGGNGVTTEISDQPPRVAVELHVVVSYASLTGARKQERAPWSQKFVRTSLRAWHRALKRHVRGWRVRDGERDRVTEMDGRYLRLGR